MSLSSHDLVMSNCTVMNREECRTFLDDVCYDVSSIHIYVFYTLLLWWMTSLDVASLVIVIEDKVEGLIYHLCSEV